MDDPMATVVPGDASVLEYAYGLDTPEELIRWVDGWMDGWVGGWVTEGGRQPVRLVPVLGLLATIPDAHVGFQRWK